MLGVANQLLATIALVVGTSYIINRGKIKYAWVTIIPLIFVGITTLVASIENIIVIYWPQMFIEGSQVKGGVNLIMTAIIIVCVIAVLIDAIPKWIQAVKSNLQKHSNS